MKDCATFIKITMFSFCDTYSCRLFEAVCLMTHPFHYDWVWMLPGIRMTW